jgi:hypothetical protein
MRPGARFRYALETLLKQRRSEQDASAARERSARGVLEGHVEDTRRAQDALAGIEGALRKARLAGAPIDARQYEAAALYLVRMREALRIKARQTEKAQELHEQTREQLFALGAVGARARAAPLTNRPPREHQRERASLAEQKQDELWLTEGDRHGDRQHRRGLADREHAAERGSRAGRLPEDPADAAQVPGPAQAHGTTRSSSRSWRSSRRSSSRGRTARASTRCSTIQSASQSLTLMGRTVQVATENGGQEVGAVTAIRFDNGNPLLTIRTAAGAFLTDVRLSQVSLVNNSAASTADPTPPAATPPATPGS